MKILCCADLCLGAVCTENLNSEQSRKWRAVRAEKLEDLIDKAIQNHASYVALFGQLFGADRVSESVIDMLFQAVHSDKHIQTLLFVNYEEFSRLSYRNDRPENLHMLCTQSKDSYLDDNIAVAIQHGGVELTLGRHDPILAEPDGDGMIHLRGLGKTVTVPSFEPLGFDDAQGKTFGFGLIEWTDETPCSYRKVKNQTYAYKTAEVKILPEDGQKEILRKINNAVQKVDRNSFLHIRLVGRSAFGVTINGDALAAQLQNKVFFVEAFDSTVMDIDTEAFETDISLRSEFVRLAMQEESLSELERNRLISCGWGALGGKEANDT